MCYQTNQKKVVMLHSKLKTGLWPSISNILNNILLSMPKFSSELALYDKDNGIEDKDDPKAEEIKSLIGSSLENIKVNIYRLNIPLISELTNRTKDGNNNF